MVRFYTVRGGRERAVGGSSLLPVLRLGGGGGGGKGSHFAGESFLKSWLVSEGHFHLRERYLRSHCNKVNDSSTKQE